MVKGAETAIKSYEHSPEDTRHDGEIAVDDVARGAASSIRTEAYDWQLLRGVAAQGAV